MKIATWNIERLKHYKQVDEIHDILVRVNADILMITETDIRISLG